MATYYISPSGNDSTGNGTLGNPWFSLNKAWTVVAAGDVIYLRGGTYTYSTQQYLVGKNGSSGNPILILAYASESPIITRGVTFSKPIAPKGMVFMTANYVFIKGIRFTGMTTDDDQVDAGLYLVDINNCTFEQIVSDNNVHGCYVEGSYTGNLWLNSDFHDNYSNFNGTNGGNSDGIALSYNSNTSAVNTIRGCRAWNNGDDGFDTFENKGYVSIEDCWAWHNGYLYGTGTSAGNGVGFKLGSDFGSPGPFPNVVKRRIQNCLAWDNRDSGIHINEAEYTAQVYNVTLYNNGVQNMNFHYTNRNHIFRNVVSFGSPWDVAISANSSTLTSSYGVAGYADQTSGWTNNVSAADFVSVIPTGVAGARQGDGSLPVITFLTLASGSDLIDNGTNVGLPYSGAAPDRGAFEYGGVTPPAPSTGLQINNIRLLQMGIISGIRTTPLGPSVTINQAGGQSDPESGATINFTVVFSESVTGFATGDVTLSGTAGATTGTVTGSGTTYNVAVTGMTSNGTVIATINAGVAINGSSVANQASTSTDNSVTWSGGVATNPDISTMSYDTKSFNFNSTVPFARSFFWKTDRTKVYVLDYFGTIHQFSVTAGDISTAVYDSVFYDVTNEGSQTYGLFFKPDGTSFWVVENENGAIRQYNCTTPWSLAVVTYAGVSLSIVADDTNITGLWFKADGTKVYYVDATDQLVYQRTLSTPWNVSTAGSGTTGSYAGQEPARGASASITADGAKLYLIGYDNVAAYQYTLSTPHSSSTMVFDSGKLKDLTAQSFGESPAYLQITNNKAYVLMGQIIYQYTIS